MPLTYRPRLCKICKWDDFRGYGFSLHATKGKVGHFIGEVDMRSPAYAAGIRDNDYVVEVNGVNVLSEPHQQVVSRIKELPDHVVLLVLDKEARAYFEENNIIVDSHMDSLERLSSPSVNPASRKDSDSHRSFDYYDFQLDLLSPLSQPSSCMSPEKLDSEWDIIWRKTCMEIEQRSSVPPAESEHKPGQDKSQEESVCVEMLTQVTIDTVQNSSEASKASEPAELESQVQAMCLEKDVPTEKNTSEEELASTLCVRAVVHEEELVPKDEPTHVEHEPVKEKHELPVGTGPVHDEKEPVESDAHSEASEQTIKSGVIEIVRVGESSRPGSNASNRSRTIIVERNSTSDSQAREAIEQIDREVTRVERVNGVSPRVSNTDMRIHSAPDANSRDKTAASVHLAPDVVLIETAPQKEKKETFKVPDSKSPTSPHPLDRESVSKYRDSQSTADRSSSVSKSDLSGCRNTLDSTYGESMEQLNGDKLDEDLATVKMRYANRGRKKRTPSSSFLERKQLFDQL
ncbi:unnamed protein product [Echinostoma caproni]|uniref:PDZ domain-containing protein n=1 Tax=Echinostoma caproni TaxID=27848 RepID=A0A183AJD2_9TREM|nr:unnamed protein product [Echinostoma caproni]